MDDVSPVATDAVQRAVAMMTAWADAPDDHDRMFEVMASLSDATLELGDGRRVPLLAVGLVNLCGVLLTEEMLRGEGTLPEVLQRHGGFWARVAAGLE